MDSNTVILVILVFILIITVSQLALNYFRFKQEEKDYDTWEKLQAVEKAYKQRGKYIEYLVEAIKTKETKDNQSIKDRHNSDVELDEDDWIYQNRNGDAAVNMDDGF